MLVTIHLFSAGLFDNGTPQGEEVKETMDAVRDTLLFAKYGIPVEPVKLD